MKRTLDDILGLLSQLQDAAIHHQLSNYRLDAISIEVVVPGERWEVDFLDNGSVDVEVFKSDGTIFGESKLDELFERFSD